MVGPRLVPSCLNVKSEHHSIQEDEQRSQDSEPAIVFVPALLGVDFAEWPLEEDPSAEEDDGDADDEATGAEPGQAGLEHGVGGGWKAV